MLAEPGPALSAVVLPEAASGSALPGVVLASFEAVSGEAESASPSWAQAQGSERALGPEPWLRGVALAAAVWVLEVPGSVRVAQVLARAGPRAH